MKDQVFLCIPNLVPGGAERVLLNLVRKLTEMDVDCRVVTLRAVGAYCDELPPSVTLMELGKGGLFKTTWRMFRLFRREKPRYAITFLDPVTFPALLAGIFAPTKIIVTVHNGIVKPKHESHRFRARFKPMVVRCLYPFAYRIVAVSDGLAEHLRKLLWFGRSRVVTIYNPIVRAEMLEHDYERPAHPWFRENAAELVLVGVGRMIAQKGFDIFLRAFKSVLEQEPNARVVLLGSGRLESQIKAEAESLGIADRVDFPGFVDKPAAYVFHARLFVLSSRWEGLPTTVIEALVAGTQIVATDCPYGPSEILAKGRYGRLVPPEEPGALAAAILAALSEPAPERAFLRERAADFSEERSVAEYLKLMPELQGRRHVA